MGDKVVIGIVVIVAVIAHLWLYKWIRFKIDEGVILKYLEDFDDQAYPDLDVIASNINIKKERVSIVCKKSKKFSR